MLSTIKLWVVVVVAGLLIGGAILVWVTLLGPAFNQADYNNFNTSPQHMQAISQRFADDCQQLATTTDSTSKKAIDQDIYQLASTVNLNNIQIPAATRSCVNQAISNVTGGH